MLVMFTCQSRGVRCKAEGKSACESKGVLREIKPGRRSQRGNARESTGERCAQFVIPTAAGV
jgi:hypothetical protein